MLAGDVPLPEAANILGIDFDEEADTLGGWFIARLGRFPRKGDSVQVGDFLATVEALEGNRVGLLRFEEDPEEPGESSETEQGQPLK